VHPVGSHRTDIAVCFHAERDTLLFSSQKRPGKLWGTSVLS